MSTDSLPARFGDYTLIRKIATGGMAEIFLAQAHSLSGGDRLVALKMIHPRYAEDKHFHRMMVEEARIAVQLNHPNVGQVFDLGQWAGRYFLVMEFIDGCDLARAQECAAAHGAPFPVDVVAYIGHEVAAALAFAHQVKDKRGKPLGLIHRDISPQNVLLSADGHVKLIDFGIAKVATQIQQTQVGVIKGKFFYMSPEQAGAHDVDQRSDLFSLGICLWETLASRPLFRRDDGPTNPLAILHDVRSMPIPRIRDLRPDCPPELDGIVARLLARDVTARFQSAESVREALARFLVPLARVQPAIRLADTMRQLLAPAAGPPPTDSKRRGLAAPAAAPSPVARPDTNPPGPDSQLRGSQNMRRDEFAPSDASVIFQLGAPSSGGGIDLDWLDPSTATRVFNREEEPKIPRASDRRPNEPPPWLGESAAEPRKSTRQGPPPEPPRRTETGRTGPPPLPVLASPTAPLRDPPRVEAQVEVDQNASTQFFRRDSVLDEGASWNATSAGGAGAASPEETNARTMAVDASAIRAAHEAFAARLPSATAARTPERPEQGRSASSTSLPRATVEEDDDVTLHAGTQVVDLRATTPAVTAHPLFRWIVVLVLVAVVLAATLALLLVRRSEERGRLQAEHELRLRSLPLSSPRPP